MKFINVRDLRLRPGKVWESLNQEKEIVVTLNGKPIALMIGVNGENFEREIEVIRRARALKALDEIHQLSIKQGTDKISNREIEKEIRANRKDRRL